MKQYASYLRVSTRKQGASGLGLEAQRKMCKDFISLQGGVSVQEFVDVESGTHRERKGLLDAINYCKKNNCALVIAKLGCRVLFQGCQYGHRDTFHGYVADEYATAWCIRSCCAI